MLMTHQTSDHFLKFYRFNIILMLSLVLLANPVRAADVPYLYRAEISVVDQQSKTRKLAIKKGLKRVLVRVTGNTDIGNQAGIDKLIKQAGRYITQYSYRQIDQPAEIKTQPVVPMARASDGTDKVLVVDFQRQAIESQLTTLGISIWPAGRPRVLIWLTQESQAGRDWVRFNTEPALFRQLESAIRQRGLPFELPFLDLNDEQLLPLEMAGGLIVDPIRSASDRYQSDAILAGRSYVADNGTQYSDWLLIDDKTTQRFRTSSPAGENQFHPIIHRVADYFAAQYAHNRADTSTVDPIDNNGLIITVLGIINVDQYAELSRYLEKLSGVNNVFPSLVSAEKTQFQVDTDLTLQQLHNLIKLDRKLVPTDTQRFKHSTEPAFFYWRP